MSNLGERLKRGRQLARLSHTQKEKEKQGTLRAGNSGIMSVATGDVAGSCHRIAHLRSLGFEIEIPDDSKLIMFQMGIANEDVIARDLEIGLAADEVLLREDDIPIEWFTDNGVKVTGRPDMVICEVEPASGKNIPKLGIEIKGVASVYTAMDILFSGPKMSHLVQSCHYAWKLGNIPYRLIYKQYVNQVVPGWKLKDISKLPRDERYMDYNEKGDVKYIKPFEIVYELQITKAGFLRYREEQLEDANPEIGWTVTLINTRDIAEFYEFTSKMGETGKLGNRPLNISATGEELSYSYCKYCDLDGICKQSERERGSIDAYSKWLREVKSKLSR
jgi:hypothetical protein